MDLLGTLKQTVYSKASLLFSRATVIEGVLKGGERPLRCMFVENSAVREYLAPRTFAEPPRVLSSFRVFLPALRGALRGTKGLDLCIAVLSSFYEPYVRGCYSMRSGEWVHQLLDTASPWEELYGRFHRNPRETVRKVRKHGFAFRISRTPEDFELFYHTMYLPLARRQHGALAHIDSYREMRSFFRKGFLLLVMEKERAVAGGLSVPRGDTLVFRRVGVLNGDRELIRRGAQAAVYHYMIRHAYENTFRTLDLMKSRSFLNDGVYVHKREWGAAVRPDDEKGKDMFFFLLSRSPENARFFELNPPILTGSDGLSACTGWNSSSPLLPEQEADLWNRFRAPGIEDLEVVLSGARMPVRTVQGQPPRFPIRQGAAGECPSGSTPSVSSPLLSRPFFGSFSAAGLRDAQGSRVSGGREGREMNGGKEAAGR
ncbi:MAG: GNAT family N-acetyltransferase [Thermodesulfovibrionales bacterium]